MIRQSKLVVVWVLVAFVAGSLGCTRQKQLKATSFRQLGMASLTEGNAELALADLHKSWELDNSNPETAHFLGMAYWYKGRVLQDTKLMVQGEQLMTQSIKMDPRPNWRNNLGALYIDLGRYDEARRECTTALEDPNYRTPERALNNIGKSYIEQGQYEEALVPLKRALRVQPRACQVLWNKAAAHKGLKQWDQSLHTLNKVTDICPGYVGPYLLKAEVLWYGKRDATAALRAIEKVQALAPDSPESEQAYDLARLIKKP